MGNYAQTWWALHSQKRVPIVRRPPLPPFPQPQTYEHVLPFTPPSGPDLYFVRANFCGIRIKGAPVVPGSNPANPELVMSALLDNYPRDIQERYLETYASYGYTHLQRSLGHALGYGHGFDNYCALTAKAQSYGLFADHWLLGARESAELFVPNQDGPYWRPIIKPYIDEMRYRGLIDSACVCWQMDQMQQGAPGNPTISIIAMIAELLPSDVPLYTHWVNDAMAWWKTGGEAWNGFNVHDRFSWWQAMQPYLTGGYYQGDTTLAIHDPTTYQGKIRDTLNPFSDGRMGKSRRNGEKNFAMIAYENTAQSQFDGACSEDQGDLTGYILTCTTSDGGTGGVMAGYGNGTRMPDGSAL